MSKTLTPDAAGVFQGVAAYIAEWAERKGFWNVPTDAGHDPERVPAWFIQMKKCEKAALVVTEIAELVEALRKPDLPSTLPGFTAEEEEVADAIIRLLDYAGHYKLRIGDAVAAKMAKNEGRPYMHGKAF